MNTQPRLRRMDRIRLFDMGNFHFEVRSKQDDVFMDADDNYFIYMSGVNFINGNIIEGRYLGVLDVKSPILDDKCTYVTTDGTKYLNDGQQIRTARMVAINNKTNVIVVISK